MALEGRMGKPFAGTAAKQGVAFPMVVVARLPKRRSKAPCTLVQSCPRIKASGSGISVVCRDRIAHFRAPGTAVFQTLPKKATVKIRKHLPREAAKALGGQS